MRERCMRRESLKAEGQETSCNTLTLGFEFGGSFGLTFTLLDPHSGEGGLLVLLSSCVDITRWGVGSGRERHAIRDKGYYWLSLLVIEMDDENVLNARLGELSPG